MRTASWILIFFILFSFPFANYCLAESNYVLPYPSFMPGNTLYKIHLVIEEIEKYWYFGSIGQFKYNLQQADKYLIEAKTLFEYKQYLLADKALKESDRYFENISKSLTSAQKDKKNISQNETLLKEASVKHIEELVRISNQVPAVFIWQPEKALPTELDLRNTISTSIELRKATL